ncbi:hypothetical protein LCGC14_1182350 [marine sediment metagenome]|uniref:Uncharacterized protein n=1 Tax=marine sediment metagenome TaxID=412755 RepID=A0A0F9M9G7_9ZZZZ
MAKPQWSRILRSAFGKIVGRNHDHKVYHLARGRVHLWTRISGDTAIAHPTYNELVRMVEVEFAKNGYRIDRENRKWDVDGPCPLMMGSTKKHGRWVAELHIYLYPPA